MCSLIEYSKNYRKTAGSIENYYTDEPNNPPIYPAVDNNPLTVTYNADPITNSASFKYTSSIIRKTPNNDNNDNHTKKWITTKTFKQFLENSWYTINCEINLILTWSEDYVLTGMILQAAAPQQGNDPTRPAINTATKTLFRKVEPKLYVPAVTLSTQNNNRLLEQNGINADQKCLSRPKLTLSQT